MGACPQTYPSLEEHTTLPSLLNWTSEENAPLQLVTGFSFWKGRNESSAVIVTKFIMKVICKNNPGPVLHRCKRTVWLSSKSRSNVDWRVSLLGEPWNPVQLFRRTLLLVVSVSVEYSITATHGRMPRRPVLDGEDFNHGSNWRSGHSSLWLWTNPS